MPMHTTSHSRASGKALSTDLDPGVIAQDDEIAVAATVIRAINTRRVQRQDLATVRASARRVERALSRVKAVTVLRELVYRSPSSCASSGALLVGAKAQFPAGRTPVERRRLSKRPSPIFRRQSARENTRECR